MKDYKKIICLTAAVCLLGAAAFCGYHIYDHYAHEAEQTEAFENIAAIVEQAQTEDNDAPEVPLTEEENVLAEYGELFEKHGYGRLAFHSRHAPQLSRDADAE